MPYTYVACPNCRTVNKAAVDSGRVPVCASCKQDLPLLGAVQEISGSALLALVEKSPLPVIVDCWAPWCGPCKSFVPVFEQAAREYAGRVVFAKLNTDENQIVAGNLGIRSIPTLLFYQRGAVRDRVSGALPQAQFRQWLDSKLATAA